MTGMDLPLPPKIHSPSIITRGISGNRESIFIAFGLSEDE